MKDCNNFVKESFKSQKKDFMNSKILTRNSAENSATNENKAIRRPRESHKKSVAQSGVLFDDELIFSLFTGNVNNRLSFM